MKIEKLSRELTVEELESIKRFRTYTDGVSFACLADRVMALLHDEPSKDVEKLKAKAVERMEEALSMHPDFDVWTMDDGRILLCLNCGIFAFTDEPCEGNMAVYMALRSECLDAAEKMEVLAVAYEEE